MKKLNELTIEQRAAILAEMVDRIIGDDKVFTAMIEIQHKVLKEHNIDIDDYIDEQGYGVKIDMVKY